MLQQGMREARNRREDGFTLIELLIVIVVLGVLAGIVVFGVAKFRTDSSTSACQAEMKTVQIAEEAYYAKNAKYIDRGTLVTAGYLKAATATDYALTVTATNTTYNIAGSLTDTASTSCGAALTN